MQRGFETNKTDRQADRQGERPRRDRDARCPQSAHMGVLRSMRLLLPLLLLLLLVRSGGAVQRPQLQQQHRKLPEHPRQEQQQRQQPQQRELRPSQPVLPVQKKQHPTSALYMHVFKTGGTSIAAMLKTCAKHMCARVRRGGGDGRNKRRTRKSALGKPGASVQERSEADVCRSHEAFMPFTTWSRRETCKRATEQKERDMCQRLHRSPSAGAVLVRYPELVAVVRKFAIVSGHIRFRYIPEYLLQRDVRITTLRNSTTTWASSVLYTATHPPGKGTVIDTVQKAHDRLAESLDKQAPNAAYIGQLRWFCADFPDNATWSYSIRTEDHLFALERCVEHAKQNLRAFNVVGILERPQSTMALLHAHLGEVCNWKEDAPPSHKNEATVSTSAALNMLNSERRARLQRYVRYDTMLYKEALLYNDELVRQMGISSAP